MKKIMLIFAPPVVQYLQGCGGGNASENKTTAQADKSAGQLAAIVPTPSATPTAAAAPPGAELELETPANGTNASAAKKPLLSLATNATNLKSGTNATNASATPTTTSGLSEEKKINIVFNNGITKEEKTFELNNDIYDGGIDKFIQNIEDIINNLAEGYEETEQEKVWMKVIFCENKLEPVCNDDNEIDPAKVKNVVNTNYEEFFEIKPDEPLSQQLQKIIKNELSTIVSGTQKDEATAYANVIEILVYREPGVHVR